ncbi:unnamed protein product [Brachionus calyciflorus]|uniref:SOCS box domain-containing protein n=1 Tax=Brachionus calyciflorus TaxID=104777 RepID=A0A813M532_9BILA|nr:unnamed protein product [Brachionus calyciflorus]
MAYTGKDLYLAIRYNHLAKATRILESFNLVNNEFFDNQISYITLAVLNNSQTILEKLIEHGADVNRLSYLNYQWPLDQHFNSFETALITATRHGNENLCEVLLKNNAKVNKTDSFSMSALHWACSLNLVEIIKLLFKYEVNENLLDLKNQTALDKAIQNGNSHIVYLFTKRFSLQSKLRDYLLEAIKCSNYEIFKILLEHIEGQQMKFDVNFIDDRVGSLLHYAVILSNLNNIQNERNRNRLDFSSNKQLVPVSKIKIIENLILNGQTNVNIVNRLGETPLHMCRNIPVGRLLLDNGASMNICEVTGKMPLFTYILNSNYEMCIEMLKNGCGLENIDRLGNSLFNALINSNAPASIISLLLEAGISFNKEEWVKKRNYPQKVVEKYPKVIDLIEYRLKNPFTLKELSRKALRQHLNKVNHSKSILNSVFKLEKVLPTSLQDYILLNLNKFESIFLK